MLDDKFARPGLALAFISANLVGNAALAQTGALEEVIVTATKRAESLQDIPISVNALTESAIQEAGVTDISDVAALVPSLTVSQNINPFSAAIRIRGFGTSQNDPSLEASVAFILDGVYMGSSGLGMSDLTDIERIEVLQGPQGTLYGKNSNAGVVSVTTKTPNIEEREGFFEVSLGDYSHQRYVGFLSGPVNDSLAYSLSGSWHETDGWMESDTGDDLNAVEDWNVRGKLLWLASDELNVQVTYSHVDRDTSCCAADATQTDAVNDQLEAKGLPLPKNDAFDYKNNQDTDSSFDLESDMVNIQLEYDLDTASFTSISAWSDYDYTASTDVDRSDLAVVALVDDRYTGELYSQELRVSSELDGPMQYMLGAFYAYEERTRGGEDEGTVVIGEDAIAVSGAQTGLGPLFAALVQPGDTVFFDSKWETNTFALFGQLNYDFSEDWAGSLGLRYTTEDKDADLFTEPFSTAPTFGTGNSQVERGFEPVDESFNRDADGFTGLASLTWFATEEIMLFASVSSGTKSGGFNGVAGEGAPREFDDEDSVNYELGIKSELFNNRLQLNATAFYTEFNDLQFLAQNPNGVGTFVSNAAEGTSAGVDLSFSALPWKFLVLSGGLQYLDAEYTEGELDELDLEVPYAPDWSGNLAATLLLPVADGVSYLRGDYSFMSDHFSNPTYQVDSDKQDKTLVNLRLGWRNDTWDAAVWVRNATDEAYSIVSLTPNASTGTAAQFLEAPRTWGGTVRYNF